MQWPQTLLPTCRWVVSATSRTSWRSAGRAPPSSRTSCFRPNIRYATDWRTALNGRWSTNVQTSLHALSVIPLRQLWKHLIHQMMNIKVAPAASLAFRVRFHYEANNTRVKALTASTDSLQVHFESWLWSRSSVVELLLNCFFDVFCPRHLAYSMFLSAGLTTEWED